STGGVSGISIILGHYTRGLSAGAFVFIINQVLLLVGFLFLGRSFGLRTAYASLLMSGFIWAMEYIYPMARPMTSQPLLELIFAVTFPAIGSAILFNMQASSGGTDIVAMLLKKKTNVNIGRCLLFVDFSITVVACVAFGMETGLFSILGLILKSVIVDMALENINVHKSCQIITDKPKEIVSFIVHTLSRGATEIQAQGAYTHEEKTIILAVVNRAQAVLLRKYAKSIDPASFILITNTSEIIGKGFRGVM
ncbi:MAG: YitT family protein, partial [Clostridia bacterium]